ncbi:MAG: hypothetical protein K6E93_07165 [Bacteroidales bacterium]|nr:hypothetical protein [Bacteroidales bacterium]
MVLTALLLVALDFKKYKVPFFSEIKIYLSAAQALLHKENSTSSKTAIRFTQ